LIIKIEIFLYMLNINNYIINSFIKDLYIKLLYKFIYLLMINLMLYDDNKFIFIKFNIDTFFFIRNFIPWLLLS